MHPHAALITRFYTAFQQRDHARMIACYHPEIHFTDPAFDLHGKRAGAMWHMLCERGKDLTLTFSDIHADDTTGRAHWEARYSFSKTGRQVHNVIDATFGFRDGLILRHEDHFDFWKWTRMALGTPGLLLGWTPMLQSKIQTTAAAGLDAFIARHPEYQ